MQFGRNVTWYSWSCHRPINWRDQVFRNWSLRYCGDVASEEEWGYCRTHLPFFPTICWALENCNDIFVLKQARPKIWPFLKFKKTTTHHEYEKTSLLVFLDHQCWLHSLLRKFSNLDNNNLFLLIHHYKNKTNKNERIIIIDENLIISPASERTE